ncbi:MAG: YjfB family protein [Lachnospira sp.]|nr:YjfB family protein [Lachnospira sp.]
MNISSLSIPMSHANVSNDIEVLMLKKSLDTLETTGDGIQKMLETSVMPHLGQNIDYSV